MGANTANLQATTLVNPGRHYGRAPIVEAVLDIHVTLPPTISLAELMKVHVGLEEAYPTKRNPMILQWQVAAGTEVVASSTSQTQTGYAFVSRDETQVFQARRDGFSFNRLPSYDRWETLRAEAQRLWEIYRRVTNPTVIQQISLRYINKIDLPMPCELKDYFRTYPEASSDLPEEFNRFAVQFSFPLNDISAMLLLNMASVPPTQEGMAGILLDIQVFRQLARQVDEAELWGIVEQLRIRKNQIFEACITDRLRERIS